MKELLVDRRECVVILTLNRPEKMNALSASLVEMLLEEINAAVASDTRLLILEGAGRNFCAGFDFTGYEKQSEGDLVLRFIRIETLLQTLYHAPFDTLALAHGRNFGAGVDIICSCGRRIATESASFQMPGLKFGLLLGTRRYAARVGESRARHILQEGIAFGAMDGLSSGFLTEILAQDTWSEIIVQASHGARQLTADVQKHLYMALANESRNADLADLVRSAAVPGLKQRIETYRIQKL